MGPAPSSAANFLPKFALMVALQVVQLLTHQITPQACTNLSTIVSINFQQVERRHQRATVSHERLFDDRKRLFRRHAPQTKP